MKTLNKDEKKSSTFIKEFALKNYKIYVAHYESRNLQPMPFHDFLKNYNP
jgi:hypothetical protein